MTGPVQEIKPPRGAILSVDKLIQRTSGGGVVYGVWCLGPTPTVERLTEARRTADAESSYVVRLRDGTLEERMGLSPCILVRSLDNDEDESELRPMAYSALNLDGPVYRQCFAFSLREQAEAFAESQRGKIAPPVTKRKDYTSPAALDMVADQRAELETLRQIARAEKEIIRCERGKSVGRTFIGLDTSEYGDKYASREYFYEEFTKSPRRSKY